jgi:hypothetical protein
MLKLANLASYATKRTTILTKILGEDLVKQDSVEAVENAEERR